MFAQQGGEHSKKTSMTIYRSLIRSTAELWRIPFQADIPGNETVEKIAKEASRWHEETIEWEFNWDWTREK